MKKNDKDMAVIPEELLEQVSGGMAKPSNCGGPVDQYVVRPGEKYYYHYTGGGHDTWLIIRVDRVVEESKGILWFTERFAYVTYENGTTGKLPLDTGDTYYITGIELCSLGGDSSPLA